MRRAASPSVNNCSRASLAVSPRHSGPASYNRGRPAAARVGFGNGHTAAVVVRMIAAIATHEHNPRLPVTIQSSKIPRKEGEETYDQSPHRARNYRISEHHRCFWRHTRQGEKAPQWERSAWRKDQAKRQT